MEDNILKPTAIKAKETLVYNSEWSSTNYVKLAHPRNGRWYEVSMCTRHTFQSLVTLRCLVLQVSFPKKQMLRWRLGCRKFTVESSWGQHLTDTERGGTRKGEGGEGGEGRERGRTGRERG